MDDENYTGCVLCIHGIFIPGDYPQQVKCSKFGTVPERDSCEGFTGQPIQEVDPINPQN